MSKINGDKARTAVQKRHNAQQREKDRQRKADAAAKAAKPAAK